MCWSTRAPVKILKESYHGNPAYLLQRLLKFAMSIQAKGASKAPRNTLGLLALTFPAVAFRRQVWPLGENRNGQV